MACSINDGREGSQVNLEGAQMKLGWQTSGSIWGVLLEGWLGVGNVVSLGWNGGDRVLVPRCSNLNLGLGSGFHLGLLKIGQFLVHGFVPVLHLQGFCYVSL